MLGSSHLAPLAHSTDVEAFSAGTEVLRRVAGPNLFLRTSVLAALCGQEAGRPVRGANESRCRKWPSTPGGAAVKDAKKQ